jgi:hypothetical protein
MYNKTKVKDAGKICAYCDLGKESKSGTYIICNCIASSHYGRHQRLADKACDKFQ